MRFGDHEIRSITEALWSTRLGLNARHCPDWLVDDEGAGWTTAFVLIEGTWCGTIVLCCPAPLAERVARCTFATDYDGSSAGQVADALGELVNQTGGNLKELLTEPCTLSLPTVLHGTDGNSRPRGRLTHRVAFACEGQTFTVSVLQR